MAGFFDVDYSLVAERLLPPHLRQPKMLAWLGVLFSPLQTSHDDTFNVYKPDIEKRARFNSQTMVLRQILNDKAGITSPPQIYIDTNDLANKTKAFIFDIDEGYSTSYIYSRSEMSATTYIYHRQEFFPEFDFTVYIPLAYSGTTDIVNATVLQYRIAGVTHQILYY